MRVLIINPPAKNGAGFVREGRCEQRASSFQYLLLPVSLISIAAILKKKKFKVRVIDAIADKMDWQNLADRIKKFSPRMIILNVSTVTFNSDMHIARKIREILPDIHLSAIGVHVTALPEEALKSEIDSVIRREPEETAIKLAWAIKNKIQLKKILGISYKKNGRFYHNKDRPWIENLDELPFPARELVENEKYLMAMSKIPHTVLVSSRGCDQNCIFCTARQYYGNKLRLRSAKNVADEMEMVKNKFGIKYITMWSDTFTLDRDFVIELCREVLERGLKIKWMCNSRVDTIDEEMLVFMEKAGCIGIAFGVESGVQSILDRAGKKIRVSQIKKAFALMKKTRIESLAHFILGLPGETKETIKETVKFAKKIDPDYAQFYCAVPFPGTPLRTLAKQKGWIASDNWRDYEINQAVLETKNLSRRDLEKARQKAYLSFYLRPGYIYKKLSRLRSLSDIKFFTIHSFKFLRDWGLE